MEALERIRQEQPAYRDDQLLLYLLIRENKRTQVRSFMKLVVEVDIDEVSMVIRSVTTNGRAAKLNNPSPHQEPWYTLYKQPHVEHAAEAAAQAGVLDPDPCEWEVQLVEQHY